jgi:hypothetical protein
MRVARARGPLGGGGISFLRHPVSTHLDELFPCVNQVTHLDRLPEVFLNQSGPMGGPFESSWVST